MLMESFVAIMALVAGQRDRAGRLLRDELARRAVIGTTPASAAAKISEWGFAVTPEQIDADRAGRRREHHPLARRRRADARRRHGADLLERASAARP